MHEAAPPQVFLMYYLTAEWLSAGQEHKARVRSGGRHSHG